MIPTLYDCNCLKATCSYWWLQKWKLGSFRYHVKAAKVVCSPFKNCNQFFFHWHAPIQTGLIENLQLWLQCCSIFPCTCLMWFLKVAYYPVPSAFNKNFVHTWQAKWDLVCIILQSNWNEITDNFDDMNLKETLLRGIYAYGFEKPSAIQQRAIIPCIKGTSSVTCNICLTCFFNETRLPYTVCLLFICL